MGRGDARGEARGGHGGGRLAAAPGAHRVPPGRAHDPGPDRTRKPSACSCYATDRQGFSSSFGEPLGHEAHRRWQRALAHSPRRSLRLQRIVSLPSGTRDDPVRIPPPPLDAVRILRREHEVLRRMFLTFTRVRPRRRRTAPRRRHRRPDLPRPQPARTSRAGGGDASPARASPRGASAVRQLSAGHALVGALIAQLDELEPGDPGHHAAMSALASCVSAHFAEEESGLFPHLCRAGHRGHRPGDGVATAPAACRRHARGATPSP